MDTLIFMLIGVGCHLVRWSKSSQNPSPSKAFCRPRTMRKQVTGGLVQNYLCSCWMVEQNKLEERMLITEAERNQKHRWSELMHLRFLSKYPAFWMWMRSLSFYSWPEKMTAKQNNVAKCSRVITASCFSFAPTVFLLFFAFFSSFSFQFWTY